jgi:riboflavin synthase
MSQPDGSSRVGEGELPVLVARRLGIDSAAMFTGIVEEAAAVISLERGGAGARLSVLAERVSKGAAIGESVAVNGCCLTIAELDGPELRFDLLAETLRVTNLGECAVGSSVNLERALPADGRLGGHFVQGHIDCTAEVLAFEPSGADHRLEIALPTEFARYVILKGSIAVNGISLTVAELKPSSFAVWLIPHTIAVTNLSGVRAGDRVNLEFDLLAKYLERLLQKG